MTKFAGVSGLVTKTEHYTPILRRLLFPSVWSQNTAFAVAFSGNNIDKLLASLQAKSVEIDNLTEVEDFLAKHDYMVTHMYSIPSKIAEYFGNAKLKLGLFSDPDSPDDYWELYLEVETHLSPEEANTKLSKINREWIIALDDLIFFNITLRFV